MFIDDLNRYFIIPLGKYIIHLIEVNFEISRRVQNKATLTIKVINFITSVYVTLRKHFPHFKEAEVINGIAHSL